MIQPSDTILVGAVVPRDRVADALELLKGEYVLVAVRMSRAEVGKEALARLGELGAIYQAAYF